VFLPALLPIIETEDHAILKQVLAFFRYVTIVRHVPLTSFFFDIITL
jgi:hypothetical protein